MQREQLVAIKLETIIFNALFSITASPFNSFLCNGGLMLSSWGHTGRMIRSDQYFYIIIMPENITHWFAHCNPAKSEIFAKYKKMYSKSLNNRAVPGVLIIKTVFFGLMF